MINLSPDEEAQFFLRNVIELELEEQSVPKMKTRKAVKARFKVTATGKLLRRRPGRRHILTKKSSKRKRKLRTPALVDKGQLKTYKRLMGLC